MPNSTTGEREADFINCISWGKQAETITKYLDKGSQLLIQGRMQNSNYEDKQGNKRITIDIVVEEFEFVGNKKENKVQDKEQKDPFEEFGETVTIDDNILE